VILLGLDLSTTCIGWSIIKYDNDKFQLIDIGYFEPLKNISKTKKLKELTSLEFLDMLEASKVWLKTLMDQFNPDIISIEDYIRFLSGGSGAATILPLACLNRAICLYVYEYVEFNKEAVKICNVMSIRSLIKRNAKLTALPKKEEIPPILEKLMNIKLPVVYEEKRKNKRISSFTYDQSDSVACVYYAVKI
jgi:Holliday junction resolvasome RuvABC endonuclease subunit